MARRSLVLCGLVLALCAWSAQAQECSAKNNVTVELGFFNGAVSTIVGGTPSSLPANTQCEFFVSFKSTAGVVSPDRYPLVARFQGSNVDFGGELSIYAINTDGSELRIFTSSGTNAPTLQGDAKKVGGGITTKYDAATKTLTFLAVSFRVMYRTGSSSRAPLTMLFEIAEHQQDQDLDNDGFIWPTEDCCDTQRVSGGVPACTKPTKVNMQAYEIGGNGIIDSGAGLANCANMALDVEPPTSCSARTCNAASGSDACTATDLAQAMELCTFPTGNQKSWGVLQASFHNADGSAKTSCLDQFGVQTSYVNYYGSTSVNAAVNQRFAVLSSGRATGQVGSTGDSICSTPYQYCYQSCGWFSCKTVCETRYELQGTHQVPSAYTSKHGNTLPTAPGCASGDPAVYESAMLRLRIRAPTNAEAFVYRLMFLSQEFPTWVCTRYNDMFLALLSETPTGFPTPADTNVAMAPIPPNNAIVPLSINIASFFTVCVKSGSTGPNCNSNSFNNMLSSSYYTSTTGAGTAVLSNVVPILPGSTFTIDFLVFDTGDRAYQSTAILDAFQWVFVPTASSGVGLEDGCPTDPVKTEPGVCGCNVPDVDTDGDGKLDCQDMCPNDPNKILPGLCGCGVDDFGYVGWDPYCYNTNMCCIKRGYLGGTISFEPTTTARTDEVIFSASMFLERDDWCRDGDGKFRKCSMVNTAVYGTVPPNVGDELPSVHLNFGVECPASGYALTTCTQNCAVYDNVNDSPATSDAYQVVTSPTAVVNSNYLLASQPVNPAQLATFTVSVPAPGTYFVQLSSVTPSTMSSPITSMQYQVFYNGGTQSRTFTFVHGVGTGFRTLGSFPFTGAAGERVEVRPVDTGAYLALVDAVRVVSYNPDCDIHRLSMSSAPVDRYFYVPSGQTVKFEVVSSNSACDPDVLVGLNTIPTGSGFPNDTTAGSGNVQILSTGGTYVVRVQLKSSSKVTDCPVSLIVSRVYNTVVQSYDSVNNLIVTRSRIAYQYPPRSLIASPPAWLASYEGIARSRGTELGRSFRSQVSVAVPQTASPRWSPAFALPPILVAEQGSTTPFSISGIPAADVVVSFNTKAGCSAIYFPPEKGVLADPRPPGATIDGTAATSNLRLTLPSNVAVGEYTTCLLARDQVTNSITPFDFIVRVVAKNPPIPPSNKAPVFVSNDTAALQGCPSYAVARATDADAADAVSIDYVNFPFANVNVTSTPGTNPSSRTIRFDFIPNTAGSTSVFLTARDDKGGFAYLNLPINVRDISSRGCPSTSQGLCNGKGTCNCDGSCTCTTPRYSGANCATYQNSAPTVTTAQILMTEDNFPDTFQLVASDPDGDNSTFALVSTSSAGATVTVSSTGLVTVNTKQYYHTNGQYTDSFTVRVTDNAVEPKSSTKDIKLGITHVNHKPVALPYSTNTQENCDITGQLSATDVDAGDILTFSSSATPSLGTLTLSTGGSFRYVCKPYSPGTETFSFSVSDGKGGSATSTVTIVIADVNFRPIANPLSMTQNQDTVFSGTLTATDYDGDTLEFRVSKPPVAGTLNLNAATGAFTFTPVQYDRRNITFEFIAVETNTATKLSSTAAIVTLTLRPVNHAPTVNNIVVTIKEDSSYSGVLVANDVDNDPLTYSMSAVSGLSFNANTRQFTYTLAADSVATVVLAFSVSDGTVSTPGTVTINVTPINDPPTFDIMSSLTVLEDAGLQTVANFVSNIVMGPADEAGQSVKSISVTTNNPSLFSTQPSIDNNGRLTYTTAADANGVAILTVVVTDNGGNVDDNEDTSLPKTSTLTVTPVNDAPSFTLAPTVTVLEDSGLVTSTVATSIRVGPANEAGQTYTFQVTSSCPPELFSVAPTIGTDGKVSFTPAPNRYGACNLSVYIKDNGGVANGGQDSSAPQTLTITVTAVNDPPTFTAAFAAQTVAEDAGAQTFDFASNISPGPFESDAVAFDVANNNAPLFAVQPAVSSDGKLIFTTAPDANGVATLSITLRETSTSPPLSSNTVTVTITVTAVNDPPTFTLGTTAITLLEDATYSPTNVATSLSPGGGADEASQSLTFIVSHSCSASLFSSAPTMTIIGTNGRLAFTLSPNQNTAAPCTISLTLRDSAGGESAAKTIQLTVTPVNDAPSFSPGAASIGLNDSNVDSTYIQSWATSISAGPADEAGQSVNFVVTNSNNGLFVVQPFISATGVLEFTIKASTPGEATVTVTLKDNGGTANGGQDSSASVTLQISVVASGYALAFTMSTLVTVAEDSGLYSSTTFITGIDCGDLTAANSVQADVTIVSSSSSASLLFASMPAVTVNTASFQTAACINGVAALTFTPAPDAFGTATIDVSLRSSRSVPVTKSFVLTITAVNDPPSFTLMDTAISRPEDVGAVQYNGLATSISAGPFDEAGLDGQSVSFNVTCDANANAMFAEQPAISETGRLTFTSKQDAFGSTSCSVVLADSKGAKSPPQTLVLTLTPVNDPPTFTLSAGVTVLEDSGAHTSAAFATAISPGPANEASQTVEFTLTAADPSLFAAGPHIDATGELTFTPATDAFGSTVVSVVLTDSEGASAPTRTFTVTITSVNDAPAFTLGAVPVVSNQNAGSVIVSTFFTGVAAGPANEASQTLTWNITATDTTLFARDTSNNVQLAVANGADLVYTLAPNRFGSTTVTVTLADNGGTANGGVDRVTKTFTLTVNFVNQPPTFVAGASQTVNEDAPLTTVSNWATAISAGTPYETSQTVTFEIVSYDSALLSALSITATGTLSFRPAADRYGATSVVVRLCDNLGLCSSPSTFTITVRSVNDAPTFAVVASSVNMEEDKGTQSAQVINNISPGATWGEDSQTVQVITVVQSCSLAALCTVQPFVDQTGKVVVAPGPDAYGTIRLTVSLKDNGGTSNGGIDTSVTHEVTVNVLPVNDAPSFTIAQPTVQVDEDSGASVIANVLAGISPGPYESDQTVAFNIVSVTVTSVFPSTASLFSVAPTLSSTGVLSFAIPDYVRGTATVAFYAQDSGDKLRNGENRTPSSGTTSFTIVVKDVDHAPVAVADSFTFLEDASPELAVTANDYSVDLDDITVSWVSPRSARGSTLTVTADGKRVKYTPVPYTHGSDSFYYIATDSTAPLLFSQNTTVTLSITHVNHPPVTAAVTILATEDVQYSAPATSALSGSDPDGDAFTFAIVSGASHGTVELVAGSPQTLRYKSNPYYCGTDSFTYKAVDSSSVSSTPSTATVLVACVNNAPTANNLYFEMPENTHTVNNLLTINIVANDNDVGDLAQLTYSCSSLPKIGSVNIDTSTWRSIAQPILYNPPPYKNGNDSFACKVRDPAGAEGAFTVSIKVIGPDNHPPVIVVPYLQISGTEDVPGSGQLVAQDYDQEAITYSIVTPPNATICTINLNVNTGSFTYTPKPNANGNCGNWTWRVTDARGMASQTIGSVLIVLAPVNDEPVAIPCTATAYEDTTTSNLKFTATDVDLAWEGDTLTYLLITQPAFGEVRLDSAATGSFSYIGSTRDWYGVTVATFRVRDAAGAFSNLANCTITVVNVNDPPTAAGANVTTAEDTPITLSLPWNDIDSPLAAMTFSIVGAPSSGSIISQPGAGNPSVTYRGILNFFGQDSFQYQVSDGQFAVTATVLVTVTPVNDAPVATDATWTIPANSEYSDVAPGYDVDSTSLTAQLVGAGPTKGTVTFVGGREIKYVPTPSTDPNYTADDAFQFRLYDGELYSNTATISVRIAKSSNMPPIANSTSVSVYEGQSISGFAQASDPEKQPLTFVLVTPPATGQLTLNTDGSFVFQSEPYRRQNVSFAFRARDAFYSSSVATVTIFIIPVNHAPTASNLQVVTNEDVPVSGTLVGSDPDGDTVTFAFENNGISSLGTATISGNTFTYTPRPDVFGVDSLLYRASDGSLRSAMATLNITIKPVNDAPVAYDQSNTMDEDGTFTGTLVATDVDSLTLTFALDPNVRSTGSVTLNPVTGVFTYTPPLYWHGGDSFAFTANDGALTSNRAFVYMTIRNINHAPEPLPVNAETDQNVPVTFELRGSDVDSEDTLAFQLVAAKSRAGATLSLSGNLVTYTPASNYYGPDEFFFTVFDGIVYAATEGRAMVFVQQVNQPPTVANNSVAVVAGRSVVVNVVATDIDTAQSALALTLPGTLPLALGAAELVPDPPLSFRYTAGSAPGTEKVAVSVSDGMYDVTGYITVYITSPAARPPRVSDMYIAGTENQPLQGKLTTSFNSVPIKEYLVSSVDNTLMTFTANTNLQTGAFELTFKPYWYGTLTFKYRAVDTNGAISNFGTVTVTVVHVNHAPVAEDGAFTVLEDGSGSYVLRGSDADGDAIRAVITRANELVGHTFSLDPSSRLFTFTPRPLFDGVITFQFAVTDGQLQSAPATVTITVTPINHPPTARDLTFTFDENTVLEGRVMGDDVDGDYLSYAVQSSPQMGTLLFDAGGNFTFTPVQYQRQTMSFLYVARDATSQSATARVTFVINPINQLPEVTDLTMTVREGSLDNRGQLSGYDVEDGTALTFVLLSEPAHGVVSVEENGAFSYSPDAFYPRGHSPGSDSFTFTAYDSDGAQANVATVSITVMSVQDRPHARTAHVTLAENTFVVDRLNGTDEDGDPLTFHVKFTARNGVFELDEATGVFKYTPNMYFNGNDLVSFSVNDGFVDSNVANLIITVTPVNQEPVASDGAFTMTAGETYMSRFNVSDVDTNDRHKIEIVQQPTAGQVRVQGLTFVYSVDAASAATSDSFLFVAIDAAGAQSNIATISVTINPAATVPRTNTDNSNAAGTNIAGGAVGGVLAALAAVAVLFFAYRHYQLKQMAALNIKQLTTEMDVYDNPLYQSLSHEAMNPLYAAPGEQTEVFTNPAFTKDTPLDHY